MEKSKLSRNNQEFSEDSYNHYYAKTNGFNKHYSNFENYSINDKIKENYYRKSGFYSLSPQLTRNKSN